MDISELRKQFPILNQWINGHQLCYLDTAATSQKPICVIDAINDYYLQNNANVHRAAHYLSSKTTQEFENIRKKVQEFIHAKNNTEIIFTSGATQSLNTIAYGLSHIINQNDTILIDSTAHHANIVPWQELAKRSGAKILPIPLNHNLQLDQKAYKNLFAQHKIKLVALNHVSNVLGTINPLESLISTAKQHNAITVIDGSQAIAHLKINVQKLDCDFYVFSGHKMYGPTGVGILYGRFHWLNQLSPMLTGGEMIKSVSFANTIFGELPNRLEAGTPPIAEVIGLGAAIDFLHAIPLTIFEQEANLLRYLQKQLQSLPEITLYGNIDNNLGVVAFNIKDEHHQDVGILLDQQGIAIRCGHHCAEPLMQLINIKGCCRASIGIYNNKQDIDLFINGLKSVIELLK